MASQWMDVGSIGSYFESLSDPRHLRNRKHLLVDIVVISICGILCGANGPTAIHRWARSKSDWLAKYLDLPNNIPSRDCIRRLLMVLKPEAFQECFQDWIASGVQADESGQRRLIAIDGKSCRRSHDASKDLGQLHIVSAWASEQGIALGQVAVDGKSNEITAIPQFLEQMDRKRPADHVLVGRGSLSSLGRPSNSGDGSWPIGSGILRRGELGGGGSVSSERAGYQYGRSAHGSNSRSRRSTPGDAR